MTEIKTEKPVKRMIRHLSWVMTGKGYGALLSLFYLSIVTHSLGPRGFGVFALISSGTLAIGLVVGANTWPIIAKYGNDHLHNKDYPALMRLIRLCTIVDLIGALLAILIAILIILFGQKWLKMPPELQIAALAYVVIISCSIRNVPRGILRIFQQFRSGFFVEAVVPTIKTLGAVLAWSIWPDVKLFLIIWALAELVSTLAYWRSALRHLNRAIGKVSGAGCLRAWQENAGLKMMVAASYLGNITYGLGQQLPLFLVGSFAGPTQAGLFRLAHQLTNSVSILAELVNLTSFTEMTQMHSRNGLDKMRGLYLRVVGLTAIIAILLWPVLYFVGEHLIILMSGEKFKAAYPYLLVLGIASCCRMIWVVGETMLLTLAMAKLLMTIRILATAVLVFGLFYLLKQHGALGAAWAKVIGEGFTLLLLLATTGWLLKTHRKKTNPAL